MTENSADFAVILRRLICHKLHPLQHCSIAALQQPRPLTYIMFKTINIVDYYVQYRKY